MKLGESCRPSALEGVYRQIWFLRVEAGREGWEGEKTFSVERWILVKGNQQ